MKRATLSLVSFISFSSIFAALGATTTFFSLSFEVGAKGAPNAVAQETPLSTDPELQPIGANEFNLAPDDQSAESSEPSTLELPNLAPAIPDASNPAESTPEGSALFPNAPISEEAFAPGTPFSNNDREFEIGTEIPVDPAELERLSNDPLFREFSSAFDQAAPLPPAIPELNGDPNDPLKSAKPQLIDPAQLATALDETLAIASVDFDSLPTTSQEREILDRLDAEIARLCPLWIDAELNKNVVGRRERVWKRDEPTRFETAEPQTVDSPNDWALALDAPFFFQVVDRETGDVFYTKAGDFEPGDEIMLVRDDKNYLLAIEPGPGAPSGRAERTRILKNGQIQGVDATGKRVVDYKIGTVPLYLFANAARLDSQDGVFFVPTPESGEPRRVDLPANSSIGVAANKLALSNGRPDEIFARIVVLCKSKKRLVEILSQPRTQNVN